jgi:acyl-CoA synthetase (AMP-forming)/AMP-acid ligase II
VNRLVTHLHRLGDRAAVLTESTSLTYRDLAAQVAAVATELGDTRRLVLLETRNDVPTLVHYLGALAGGHVVLPTSAGHDHSAVLRTYDPDTVIDGSGIRERRHGTAHRLHRDLALLLSSGFPAAI